MSLWKAKKELSEEQKKTLEALDAKLPFEDVLLFRSLARALKKMEKLGKLAWQQPAKDKKQESFFSKIFDDSKKKSAVAALTPADWRLLYETISFGSDDPAAAADAKLPKDVRLPPR